MHNSFHWMRLNLYDISQLAERRRTRHRRSRHDYVFPALDGVHSEASKKRRRVLHSIARLTTTTTTPALARFSKMRESNLSRINLLWERWGNCLGKITQTNLFSIPWSLNHTITLRRRKVKSEWLKWRCGGDDEDVFQRSEVIFAKIARPRQIDPSIGRFLDFFARHLHDVLLTVFGKLCWIIARL